MELNSKSSISAEHTHTHGVTQLEVTDSRDFLQTTGGKLLVFEDFLDFS